ncbi:hypothetical protein [Campylobacter helveticus]|uniref:Uncharacterized protein n=1 Tax=Campylobacter helveticus TaxID=28898 RepID=A0AAX2UGH9_9BACT|nr:hypothetical protein [Campylobacter helveticus]ARE79782.1 hypothetical protein CHELV3228_0109 [Campylobacter helveticus]MCR2055522.1 hypothetical protein [Campylobacter helveticus]TNB54081.1 hypothetical protein FDW47_09445 [Campylobacter helveticus]TNB54673.1 hypothetical protein FDW44_10025 [Campylobacter helveticus]TNB54911.1 hypothetical protein FDW42_09825 [Campylobacter helveticus]
MKKELRKKAFKSFALWFVLINFLGIGLNALLYYFDLPNQIEYVLFNIDNVAVMSLVVFIYVMMSLLLYLAINLNHFFKSIDK